jgi:hypothetical protein
MPEAGPREPYATSKGWAAAPLVVIILLVLLLAAGFLTYALGLIL